MAIPNPVLQARRKNVSVCQLRLIKSISIPFVHGMVYATIIRIQFPTHKIAGIELQTSTADSLFARTFNSDRWVGNRERLSTIFTRSLRGRFDSLCFQIDTNFALCASVSIPMSSSVVQSQSPESCKTSDSQQTYGFTYQESLYG